MVEANRYIIKDRDQSAVGEAFRSLRASILAAQSRSDLKSILFTSASLGEGKSFIAANTAAMLAYAGKRVVLVDCDLRNPVMHSVFSLRNVGITNIINQGRPVEEVIQLSDIPNLRVLASGPNPREPAELLSDEILRLVFAYLKNSSDFVIVDSPPLISVSDACILASKVDGVALVLDARTVRVETAKQVVDLLKSARANIFGVVMNDVEIDKEFFSSKVSH